ncbi:MAG: ribbon-helix-helix domain-containing protein [Nanoarchaeota archaeon]
MKRKISVSLDEKTLEKIEEYMLDESFRNKSHVIEFALIKFIKEKENGKEE